MAGRRINAGTLNRKIYIETPSVTPDTGGGQPATWATQTNGERWASIRTLSGSESYVAAQLQGFVSHRVTTRYVSGDETNLTPKQRVRLSDDGRLLEIHQVIPWDDARREITMICGERKASD